MSTLLRIGEVAAKAAVSNRTVDYYTSLGLITPAARSGGNYRLYSADVVDRIALIRRLEAHGIGLDDIARATAGPSGPALTDLLHRIDTDLQALREVAATAGPATHGLLTATAARAHALITTAIEIAIASPLA